MNRTLNLLAAALLAACLGFAPAAAEGGGHRSTSSETYVELTGLATAVVARGRTAGILQVVAGVEASDAEVHERVLELQPRVQAACMEGLSAYAGDMYIAGTAPDADMIESMMQSRVDAAIGRPGARVLLGMVIVHHGR